MYCSPKCCCMQEEAEGHAAVLDTMKEKLVPALSQQLLKWVWDQPWLHHPTGRLMTQGPRGAKCEPSLLHSHPFRAQVSLVCVSAQQLYF